MRQYAKYLGYLARHKYFVTAECFKHGLIWRGLVHDLDKFYPKMFTVYANQFYNPDGSKKAKVRNADGSYDPMATGNLDFELAFFRHTRRNEHHWQYWVQATDGGGEVLRDMPLPAVGEMVCDWIGAGRAQGTPDTAAWWAGNSGKMRVSPWTRIAIMETLRDFGIGRME